MESLPRLQDTVERAKVNPKELGDALRKANQSYSSLMRLLAPYINRVEDKVNGILFRGGSVTPYKPSADLECLLDFIEEYVQAEPNERKKKMGLFEESYQMNPGEVTEFLKYLGLDL